MIWLNPIIYFNNAKYFSIVDIHGGYWDIPLNNGAPCILLSTHHMGNMGSLDSHLALSVCAQDIFQKKVDESFVTSQEYT